MYQIDDNISAIKELQRLLGLNPTGYYDTRTKAAVSDIQERYSLSPNGIADYTTFVQIVTEYREREMRRWNNSYLYAPDFPFTEGDMGDNVGRINEALTRILKEYKYEGFTPRGKYYGKETTDGVRFLQRVFDIQESAKIDEAFMNRIMIELDGIEIKEIYGNK